MAPGYRAPRERTLNGGGAISGRFICGPLTLQYRVQFLDGSVKVIREWSANARNVARAIELIVDADWPPRAVTVRVLDAYGRRSSFVWRWPHANGEGGETRSVADTPRVD